MVPFFPRFTGLFGVCSWRMGLIVPASCASLLAFPVQPRADESTAMDPLAIELLTGAADFLAAQPALSVNWFVSYDDVLDGREKLTYLRSGNALLERDVGFYGYSDEGDRVREYFYDGAEFSILDPEANAYVQVLFSGGFDELVRRVKDEYDVAIPIWEILVRDIDDELLTGTESAAYVGLTRVAGRPAHHLAFADYEHDWQVWIAADEQAPLLLMMVGTDPYSQGWPQYRAYFTDWSFDPEIPDGVFTFTPDETADRMAWPKTGVAVRGSADSVIYSDEDADAEQATEEGQ